jgi:hypothetical protein
MLVKKTRNYDFAMLRQAQFAFLCGTSNHNLDRFIAEQYERTAEVFVSEPSTPALPAVESAAEKAGPSSRIPKPWSGPVRRRFVSMKEPASKSHPGW